METILSIVMVAALIIGFLYILYKLGKIDIEEEHKVYGTPIYARICSFAYFVEKCSITLENYKLIEDELKEIRARREMSDSVFCNKVDEIVRTFEKRFKEWI